MKPTLFAATMAALFTVHAGAQLPKATEVPPGALAPADATFMEDANRANVAQMMLARTASKKASDGGVRSLADAVTASHVKADDALKLLAGVKHVNLPGQPDADQQTEVTTLDRTRGANADRLYVDDLIRDDEDLIAMYEDARDHSDDPDIRRYASIMLPALQDNRQRAQALLGRRPDA